MKLSSLLPGNANPSFMLKITSPNISIKAKDISNPSHRLKQARIVDTKYAIEIHNQESIMLSKSIA